MKPLKIISSVLGLSFGLLVCMNAQAGVVVGVNIGVPGAPPPGYANCYWTVGGWYNGVWIPSHQECYQGEMVWAAGYWGCTAYWANGGCRHRVWYGPHRYHGYGPHRYHYHGNPHGGYHHGGYSHDGYHH